MGSCAHTSACTALTGTVSIDALPARRSAWLSDSVTRGCNVSLTVLENQSDASLWREEKAQTRAVLADSAGLCVLLPARGMTLKTSRPQIRPEEQSDFL